MKKLFILNYSFFILKTQNLTMPYISSTSYRPPFYFRNSHWSTIYPSIFRKVPEVKYERERIELPDGDFLDVDWSRKNGHHLVIVMHGLEGSADRPYVRGIIKAMNDVDWDGVGLNFRGCSGTPNRLPCSYHSGDTRDLKFFIEKIIAEENYQSINLVGFSLGGNVTLKLLGELGSDLPSIVKRAVGISVPVDLKGSCQKIQQLYNRIYLRSFLKSLKEKARNKAEILEDHIDLKKVFEAKDFFQFDGLATAPLNGFSSAIDYYDKSSSLHFLPKITIPILLINALNDSFLSKASYPVELAKNSEYIHLLTPEYGGHVGFVTQNSENIYWNESMTRDFFLQKEEFN